MVEDKEVISAIVPSAVALAGLLLIVLGLALTHLPASRQAADQGLEGIAKLSGHPYVMTTIIIYLTLEVIMALIVAATGILSLWGDVDLSIQWPILLFLTTLLWTGVFTLTVAALVILRYPT